MSTDIAPEDFQSEQAQAHPVVFAALIIGEAIDRLAQAIRDATEAED